jgi:hypothetical protein
MFPIAVQHIGSGEELNLFVEPFDFRIFVVVRKSAVVVVFATSINHPIGASGSVHVFFSLI